MGRWHTPQSPPPAAPPPTEERLFTDWSSESSPRERGNQQIQSARSAETRRIVNQEELSALSPEDGQVIRNIPDKVTATSSA